MPLRRTLALALAALALTAAPAVSAQTAPPPDEPPAAAQQLFAVIYRPGPSWLPGQPMAAQPGMREHFVYIRDLHARGVIVLAGPRGDDGGLVLVRAVTLGEAQAVMAADPAVTSGLFVGEVGAFVARFGAVE